MTHSQDAHFRAHLERVSSHRMSCEKLLDTVDVIDSEVCNMLEEWQSVEESGRSLKDACEKLLQEKVGTYSNPYGTNLIRSCRIDY